jgi:hypothetical protein
MISWKLPFWTLVGSLAITAGVASAQELTDPNTKVSFPKEITFESQGKTFKLKGTGVSTRKKLFVKVYSVANYIEDPAKLKNGDVFEKILNSKNAKQLSFIYVRDVDKKRVQDAYRQSLEKATGGDLKAETDKYVNFFGEVKNKDKHEVRWLPDGTITVTINGQETGSIKSEAFAKALWSVWLGPNSVVKRDQLVSEIK